jgi:hypothetical protein
MIPPTGISFRGSRRIVSHASCALSDNIVFVLRRRSRIPNFVASFVLSFVETRKSTSLRGGPTKLATKLAIKISPYPITHVSTPSVRPKAFTASK